jgi:hypothetical protein
MEQAQIDLKTKIAQIRASYTRLALNCKASGIRVSPATVSEYTRKLRELEAQLN